jgi:hypothetical protein
MPLSAHLCLVGPDQESKELQRRFLVSRLVELLVNGREEQPPGCEYERSAISECERLDVRPGERRQFESGLVLHVDISSVKYFDWRGCCVWGSRTIFAQSGRGLDLHQREY